MKIRQIIIENNKGEILIDSENVESTRKEVEEKIKQIITDEAKEGLRVYFSEVEQKKKP